MSSISKIEEIDNSMMNGQNKQAREQIKRFGVSKFFIEYMHYLDNMCPEESNRYNLFKKAYRMYYL
jgi:hypothetical protein